MNSILFIIGYLISVPARIKGMKFGRNSFMGPGYDWLFVSLRGIRLGENVQIGRNAWLQTSPQEKYVPEITIGDNTHIGRQATISALKKITIGKNCLISFNVSILDHDHEMQPFKGLFHSTLGLSKEIIVGDNCFIGAHSFILKGVHLGKRCIVGANSVVTRSFPADSVIAGVPARRIKTVGR